jgi:hypothetical protein
MVAGALEVPVIVMSRSHGIYLSRRWSL